MFKDAFYTSNLQFKIKHLALKSQDVFRRKMSAPTSFYQQFPGGRGHSHFQVVQKRSVERP